MKAKGGALDRRSSARWRVLLLCAFSFGLGTLFTDRCVLPSLSLALSLSLSLSLSAGNHWILPYALGFKRLVLLGGSTHGFPFAYSLIPFEIWSLKRFLFVANSVPDGLKISEISFA
jgi:hypothetical protein